MNQSERLIDGSIYRPFPTFAFVWATTALVHQLAFSFWVESWEGWVLVLSAVAVIYRPDCLFRFGMLVVASLLHLWEKMPFVPNHILYEGMLHLTMLLGLADYYFRKSGRLSGTPVWSIHRSRLWLALVAILCKAVFLLLPVIPQSPLMGAVTTLFLLVALGRLLFAPVGIGQGDAFFARVAPVLRAAVVIMYFWAGLQKLNKDYLDPSVSCAGQLHVEIAAYFGGLIPTAPWTLQAAAIASLVFEFGIPVLLCFPRTRYLGFFAAIGFHLWLSIHQAAGIFSFSSLILAVLVLFLPMSWGQQMQAFWDAQARWIGRGDLVKGRRLGRTLIVVAFFVTLITQATLYLSIARSYEVFHMANRIGFFAFFLWGLWIGLSYLVAGWRAFGGAALPNRAVATLAWVGLIPVLLNGLWPWLGGRTQTSFSMYSNLRSEAESNHLFLKRIDLFDLQKDMVEVLTSAPDILSPTDRPRGIQQFANLGFRVLPWFEFRRLVSEREGDFEVTYLRNGTEASLGRRRGEIFGDPEAFEPLPLLQRKFLWFRRLERLDGPMCCTH